MGGEHWRRLVVVSNRVTPITGRQAASAGGLAVGVLAALRETGGPVVRLERRGNG